MWFTIGGCSNISESCLFLNVVTPNPNNSNSNSSGKRKPWPVLFYIHAGEFYMGAANDLESNQPYAPSPLTQNVVLVTANFRLGNAGWMAAPQLRHRNKDNSSGNYGLQDQREALRWGEVGWGVKKKSYTCMYRTVPQHIYIEHNTENCIVY